MKFLFLMMMCMVLVTASVLSHRYESGVISGAIIGFLSFYTVEHFWKRS